MRRTNWRGSKQRRLSGCGGAVNERQHSDLPICRVPRSDHARHRKTGAVKDIIAEIAEDSVVLMRAMQKLKRSAEKPWRTTVTGRRVRGDGPLLTQQEAARLYELLMHIEQDMASGRLTES